MSDNVDEPYTGPERRRIDKILWGLDSKYETIMREITNIKNDMTTSAAKTDLLWDERNRALGFLTLARIALGSGVMFSVVNMGLGLYLLVNHR